MGVAPVEDHRGWLRGSMGELAGKRWGAEKRMRKKTSRGFKVSKNDKVSELRADKNLLV